MRFRKRHTNEVPILNTASLPDLIFTVLFFFMIVTHLRDETPKVQVEVPQGTELTPMSRRENLYQIYVGRTAAGDFRIQVNEKMMDLEQLTVFFLAEQRKFSSEDEPISVSLKADREADMGLITDVKLALRKANVLNVSYAASMKAENGKK